MKLYELSEQMIELQSIDYEDDASLAEAIANSLEDVTLDFHEKLNNMVKLTLNNGAFINSCDDEIARLQAHKKRLANENAQVKSYILHEMQKLGKKSVNTDLFMLTDVKGSMKVIIDDEDNIPSEYIKIKVTEAPDKTAILKALKDGNIEGCHAEQSDNTLRIK